jgi:hypothetical protein
VIGGDRILKGSLRILERVKRDLGQRQGRFQPEERVFREIDLRYTKVYKHCQIPSDKEYSPLPRPTVSRSSYLQTKMKFSTVIISVFAASAAVAAPLEKRTPPNIPSTDTAKSLLAGLGVRTTDATGYSR